MHNSINQTSLRMLFSVKLEIIIWIKYDKKTNQGWEIFHSIIGLVSPCLSITGHSLAKPWYHMRKFENTLNHHGLLTHSSRINHVWNSSLAVRNPIKSRCPLNISSQNKSEPSFTSSWLLGAWIYKEGGRGGESI